MSTSLCVLQGAFARPGDPLADIWHVVATGYVEGDWAPILCSQTEGIVLPYTERRAATCPDCRRIRRHRAVTGEQAQP